MDQSDLFGTRNMLGLNLQTKHNHKQKYGPIRPLFALLNMLNLNVQTKYNYIQKYVPIRPLGYPKMFKLTVIKT